MLNSLGPFLLQHQQQQTVSIAPSSLLTQDYPQNLEQGSRWVRHALRLCESQWVFTSGDVGSFFALTSKKFRHWIQH